MSDMNNLDIILLTAVVSASFISFIVITIKEFNGMSETPFQRKNK